MGCRRVGRVAEGVHGSCSRCRATDHHGPRWLWHGHGRLWRRSGRRGVLLDALHNTFVKYHLQMSFDPGYAKEI
ncbi:hypothetical protein FR483_n630L [Paramecium bursaria Chlorella virus FR483]|uniref:Uncharacterized protein n630L n=1 Tax=Paramecium bursaria Chlorella virus FR483 TaxID=399781 RepID=A7J7Y4_PBCVF|nr:hypothetical protein FR483_n630L [Paramecium bursaria Chlorella virus FR483]ABT15915.1 hypothetical protein FR483_n630L [Paramecium bursaria Chlorella virus FR483]